MPTEPEVHLRQTGLCPTLDRPSRQRDGLLLRVPLVGGRLSTEQLDTLADVSLSHGNGVIELTNRGNLQLRGLAASGLATAITCCARLGLADPANRLVTISCFGTPAEAALRGSVVDGLSGITTAGLSAKFFVHVPDRHGADSRPSADVSVALGDDGDCVLHVAGRRLRCSAAAAVALIRSLLEACRCAGPLARAADFDEASFAQALAAAPWRTRTERSAPPMPAAGSKLGVVTVGSRFWAVAGTRFGRTTPAQLTALADVLRRDDVPWLAVTPWRSWAVPATDASRAAALLERLLGAGGLTSADPAANVVVCVGANGCWQTELDTLGFAAGLVADAATAGKSLAPGVHVSGCEKRCATRRPAAVTFLGRADSSGFDRWVGAAR